MAARQLPAGADKVQPRSTGVAASSSRVGDPEKDPVARRPRKIQGSKKQRFHGQGADRMSSGLPPCDAREEEGVMPRPAGQEERRTDHGCEGWRGMGQPVPRLFSVESRTTVASGIAPAAGVFAPDPWQNRFDSGCGPARNSCLNHRLAQGQKRHDVPTGFAGVAPRPLFFIPPSDLRNPL